MCPLDCISPLQVWSTEGLRAAAVFKTVILSVNASFTHDGGSLWPLQLYFVLNWCVIRGAGPLRERSTQRASLNLAYTGTLWSYSAIAALCLENKLTRTLSACTFLLILAEVLPCEWLDCLWVSYSARTFRLGLFHDPYGCHMRDVISFNSTFIQVREIKLDHPWLSRAHISELERWDRAN